MFMISIQILKSNRPFKDAVSKDISCGRSCRMVKMRVCGATSERSCIHVGILVGAEPSGSANAGQCRWLAALPEFACASGGILREMLQLSLALKRQEGDQATNPGKRNMPVLAREAPGLEPDPAHFDDCLERDHRFESCGSEAPFILVTRIVAVVPM